MRLRIALPSHVLLDRAVSQVTAEATGGHFSMLERHVDFVAPLVAGVLVARTDDGQDEVFVGHDAGVLVKCGSDVTVATRRAVVSADLDALRAMVKTDLVARDESEQIARQAAARLEAGFVRQFLALEGGSGG
jgi:F-type H+-transporting ATPase subunit epsilon